VARGWLTDRYSPNIQALHWATSKTEALIYLLYTQYDMIYLLTAIGLSPGGSTHLHTNNTQNNTNNNQTTQIQTKWWSAVRAPSLRVLPWHLPYNWGKSTEKPQLEKPLKALLFIDHGTRRRWGVSLTPWPLFTPGKDPVPIVQKAGWAPGPVWTGAENLAHAGIRSPDRPDWATRPT
jgi:hypothetical protein